MTMDSTDAWVLQAYKMRVNELSRQNKQLQDMNYVGTVYIGGLEEAMPVDQYQWDWLGRYYESRNRAS